MSNMTDPITDKLAGVVVDRLYKPPPAPDELWLKAINDPNTARQGLELFQKQAEKTIEEVLPGAHIDVIDIANKKRLEHPFAIHDGIGTLAHFVSRISYGDCNVIVEWPFYSSYVWKVKGEIKIELANTAERYITTKLRDLALEHCKKHGPTKHQR